MLKNSSENHNIPNADYRLIDPKKLSPMYQHYVEIKAQYPNALLLYRVGDFFETFFQDAITVAQELELVLTSKEGGKEVGRVPMTGVPHHAIERYATLLVEKGYAIALCDQVEDSSESVGLVKREVTRVFTPGTLIDDAMLKAKRNNYLAAIVIVNNNWGLAYADISTGEFLTTQSTNLEELTQELMRLQPAEILIPTNSPELGVLLRPGEKSDYIPKFLPNTFCYALRSQKPFTLAAAKDRLLERFKLRSLEGLGCENLPLAIRAAGGLLEYLEKTSERGKNKSSNHINSYIGEIPLQRLRSYTIADYLIIDNQSRRNLEITQTVRDGSYQGSLMWSLDRTCTAMGGRTLRRWLLQPLMNIKGINARLQTIQELIDNTNLRTDLRSLLRNIYDLDRLTGKAGSGSANARELSALAESLSKLPELAQIASLGTSLYLRSLQKVPPILLEISAKIKNYLVENPPLQITEGGIIRDGVNSNLDAMRLAASEDQDWLKNLENLERDRTGINTLKVGFNKTFGYYISVSKGKTDQVPSDYIRKQTLTNEERYITPELKEREARILTAKEDLNRAEYDIFSELRAEVGEYAETIRTVSLAVAAADVLSGFAVIAIDQGYCCPEMTETREINIIEGRHPVVEQTLPSGFFVPNSTQLGKEQENDPDLIILTGPNASGKSCYLRQVGLIQLMAQMGSFVPAKSAKLAISDRIFTRVGAVDDLATGQSTFMVEMNETANILNHGTERSLVLLDEIGRGTATFDGLSIAWSVAEYIATEIKARTIFATHYHELNELASLLNNVANYQVTVKELPDQIVFLHQVQPGGADKSYGIEAARLAGLPPSVINRAKQVMAQIEKHSKIAVGLRTEMKTAPEMITEDQQLSILPEEPETAIADIIDLF
jgi:DNA mismatch repair protein MutS